MNTDEKWMRRALELARRGAGRVHPNPMVGSVLVKGGKKIAEGYHRIYGGPHAEVEVLRRAGSRARGSTLYVTLEPCSHWGKTPPCAEAVIAAGVSRVVCAMKDPNPLVSGKGFAKLRSSRVKVQTGVLEPLSQELNRAFITRITRQRPYVTLKVAASLDGRTSTITGESKWITSPQSRAHGYQLRAQVDAIAVGAGTILKDNPTLTAHGKGRNPIRIVFAGRRTLPKRLHIFNKAAPTWIVKPASGSQGLLKSLQLLAQQGITHLLVEGGPTLQDAFWRAGLVDAVVWFVAPIIIGENKLLSKAWRIPGMDDLCIQGKVTR